MTKVLAGVIGALGLAAVLLFWMLLAAKEANGQLTADLETVAEVNAGQVMVIDRLRLAGQEAAKRRAAERAAADEAARRAAQIVVGLERDIRANRARLAVALEELTDEELECAAQPVPAVLIDSLHGARAGDQDGDSGGPGS